MNLIGKNTISNLVAKLWGMVSIYIFVPLYIRFLGESSYGLVSFFSVLQSALNLLGLGLSNTLRREFAVGDVETAIKERKYKLLRSVEAFYLLIAVVIILFCALGSESIGNKWLNIENLDSRLVTNVIALMGISIAIQIVANLYSGCLFGLDRQVLANSLLVIWAAMKSIGSVVIAWRTQNLIFFYSWHCFTDLLYAVALRIYTIRSLCAGRRFVWKIRDLSILKDVWKYTFGILLISLIAIVNRQLDKIVISRYLTLTELGAYNVATTLGSLVAILPSAIYISVFPKFTNEISKGNFIAVEKTFKQLNRVTNIVICVMGSYVAVFSLPLIQMWTGSSVYVNTLGSTGFFVVMAVSVIEFQELPYALALAHGNTKTNVAVGACFIPILFSLSYIFIFHYGLFGAGMISFLMMISQSLLYEFLIFRKYLIQSPIKLIIRDTITPLSISIIIAFLCKKTCERISNNIYVIIVIACLFGGLTLTGLCYIFAKKEIKILLFRRSSDDSAC